MDQTTERPEPLTVSQLAEATSRKRHQIEYLLDARRIRPSRRGGNVKLYPPATLDFLKAELARIDRDREGVL